MVQRTQSTRHSMLLHFNLKSCTWDREPHAQVYARYREDRKQLCRKSAEVLLDKSWTLVSSMPLCWTKAVAPRAALARPYPAKEVITFGTWETMSGILSTFGLPHTIKIDVLEQVQWAVTEMITVGAQQHMRMHWSTSLVSIKSRWCGRRKPDSCLYLLWGYKEKGTRLQH